MLVYVVVAGEIAIMILMGIGGMNDWIDWFRCLVNKPKPVSHIIYKYGDEYSDCMVCGKPIHRDNHMFGDGVWRHE
jgi:hypothetical protein